MTDNKESFIGHLQELKKRVIICLISFCITSIICYIFADKIYAIFVNPLEELLQDQENRKLIFTNLTEVFFTYLKLAFFAGFILSFPVIATQLYMFIAPGLYKNEKRFFLPCLIFSPVLFILGGVFVYLLVFPLAWKFFLSFEVPSTANSVAIILEAKVSEYLNLVISLIIAFGLVFQLPLILILLVKFGIINSNWLKEKRKISIVIAFIIAAILTPPDVITQIMLAVPIIILYEISILVATYIETQKEDQNA